MRAFCGSTCSEAGKPAGSVHERHRDTNGEDWSSRAASRRRLSAARTSQAVRGGRRPHVGDARLGIRQSGPSFSRADGTLRGRLVLHLRRTGRRHRQGSRGIPAPGAQAAGPRHLPAAELEGPGDRLPWVPEGRAHSALYPRGASSDRDRLPGEACIGTRPHRPGKRSALRFHRLLAGDAAANSEPGVCNCGGGCRCARATHPQSRRPDRQAGRRRGKAARTRRRARSVSGCAVPAVRRHHGCPQDHPALPQRVSLHDADGCGLPRLRRDARLLYAQPDAAQRTDGMRVGACGLLRRRGGDLGEPRS